ncbi:HAMP domain-containing sensor histidine kinase [Vallitaleaceae bacterium 9-2]
MKRSIARQIFMVFLGFVIALFIFSGIAIRFFLPNYYRNQKMNELESYTQMIIEAKDQNKALEEIIVLFDQMRQEIGGEVYTIDGKGQASDMFRRGLGRNRPTLEHNYTWEEDILSETYENKLGVRIYAFGIIYDNQRLVYEVSITSLEEAVHVMMQFFVYLFVIGLMISVIGAFFISRQISKPIQELNALALQMKDKKVHDVILSTREDEIGQLNQSLMLMYQELLSNIQRLESELTKERAVEKMKKQFLAQATHELKTPISVIRGYAELVYDGIYKDEEERDHYITSIYNETEAISGLINEILDFSKMENGFFKIYPSAVDTSAWADHIIKTYEEYIKIHGLEVVCEMRLNHDMIDIDTNRMEQVIKNLIANAVEHAKSKVIITFAWVNQRLYIAVENDGPPIASEDMPYIFDSFYKRSGKKSGTGLGLAIVKQIVLLHHGDYRVENTEEGVRFTVVI